METFAAQEAELVPYLAPLTVTGVARAMSAWKLRAQPEPTEPHEPDRAVYLSNTLDDRYALDGSLDPEGGTLVATALRLATPEKFDGRNPAGRHRPHLNVVVELDDLEAGRGGRGDRRSAPRRPQHLQAVLRRTFRRTWPSEPSCPVVAPSWGVDDNRSPLPRGARVALSLTFDDARDSQLDVAVPMLDAHGIRATFFVLPRPVSRRQSDWETVLKKGHEIGNHTVTHPCSGNFGFSRTNALEDYSLERMEAEIDEASADIERLLGVRSESFAYPCGQSFVGRGQGRTSYVPVVSRRFLAARGYGSETSNAPDRCDFAHLDAFAVDGLAPEEVVGLVDHAGATGGWVIMAGHDVGECGEQTVLVHALQALCHRVAQPDVWVAPVAEVARHLRRGTTI